MKLKSVLRILVIMTALILTVTMVTSCGVLNIIANYVVSSMTATGATDFNDVQYTRPNFEAIHQAFDDFLIDLKSGKTGLMLQMSLSDAYKLFNDAQTMYNVAEIRYYNNVNDTEAKEESEYCAEQFASVQVKLIEVYSAIIEYNQSADLLVGWTDRDFENLEVQKKLYDDEYVELQAEIAKIQTEYMDLQQNIKFRVNENAYRYYTIEAVINSFEKGLIDEKEYRQLINKYYEVLAQESAPLYIRLVRINNRIAEKAGFDSYQEYANQMDYSRDYSISDIQNLYSYVKQYMPSLYTNITSSPYYQTSHNSPSILTEYSYSNSKPFFSEYFKSISPDMKTAYDFMIQYNLSSIGNTKGMQQAGFTTYLPSYEMPYIYLYDTGTSQTTFSFVHEFGHFYAFYKNGFESDGIIDVSEIHSQTNELLFLTHLYDKNKIPKQLLFILTVQKIADMYQTIIEGCLMDEFQSEIHQKIDFIDSYDDINLLFKSTAEAYGFDKLYQGLPYESLWAAISHNFVAPFYYISYAMSAIPALEIYQISLSDYDKARSIYLNVLDETGYRSYAEVLRDNALSSPFEKTTFTELKKIKTALYQDKFKDHTVGMSIRPYDFLNLAA